MKRSLAIALTGLVIFVAAPPAEARDGMSYWLSPRMGDRPFDVRYEGRFYDKQGVDPSDGSSLRMMLNELDLSIPITQGEERRDEWTLGVGFANMELSTDARLPDTGGALPDGFYDPGVSLTYRRRTEGGNIWGATVTIHSPSDDPFRTVDEWAVHATGFARLPRGKHDAWVLMANVSTTRDIAPGVPLPGAGYLYEKGRDAFMVGFPVSYARWHATEKVTLSGFYRFPRTVRAEAAYELTDTLEAYAGFDWSHKAWLRADRPDDDDRLFYYDKRAAGGVRWDLGEKVDLDLSGGWAFDRFFFEGEGYDDRGDDRLDIDEGPFVTLSLRVRI